MEMCLLKTTMDDASGLLYMYRLQWMTLLVFHKEAYTVTMCVIVPVIMHCFLLYMLHIYAFFLLQMSKYN